MIVNSLGTPEQPFKEGATRYFNTLDVFSELIIVWEGMLFEVPLCIKPESPVSAVAVHWKVVFVIFEVKLIRDVVWFEQISCDISEFKITGFSITSKVWIAVSETPHSLVTSKVAS